jgi:hypothetical protein
VSRAGKILLPDPPLREGGTEGGTEGGRDGGRDGGTEEGREGGTGIRQGEVIARHEG